METVGRARGGDVLPARDEVFHALRHLHPADWKVVIFGQVPRVVKGAARLVAGEMDLFGDVLLIKQPAFCATVIAAAITLMFIYIWFVY